MNKRLRDWDSSMVKCVLIESVNEDLRDTHTTLQRQRRRVGGAHIKVLERKTEKKNNWMPHKSI